MKKRFEKGSIEGSTIAIILLTIGFIGAGAFGIWSYIEYNTVKSNVDGQIELAVAEGNRKQKEDDEKKYAEQLKIPFSLFRAPEDLGKVSFSYPKTWSLYVDSDGSDKKGYFAYFHPLSVPPVPKTSQVQQRYAMRTVIYESSVADVLKEFELPIKKGEMTSEPATINGLAATKISGLFPSANKNDRIRGTAYYFKLNDKTLMLRTDADTFNNDFQAVLKTLKIGD